MTKKFSYEDVNFYFDAVFNAFHPEGYKQNELRSEEEERLQGQFMSLWTLFLACAGWTEDEFWAEWENQQESTCPDCGEALDKEDDENEKLPEISALPLDPKLN